MKPELILDAHADLGEGPSWDAAGNRLYWVDVHAGVVHRFDPLLASDETRSFGEPVGCISPANKTWKSPIGSSGEAVLALKSGIILLKDFYGTWDYLVQPELNKQGNRFNDGKCDPMGRFLAGTMDDAEKESCGSLYSYSPEGRLISLLTDVGISNGLAWSPDYKTFYFIDTPTHNVTAYDYDLSTGEIANPHLVTAIAPGLGWPDGMTSDREGMLWVAMWGGAKITRWNPHTGQLLENIPIPAYNVSSCVFGGQDLTDLYITTASHGLNSELLKKHPHSGSLFRIRTGIQGMPTFQFGK
jgi:sugar lactone lactonase YvrE